MLAIVTWTVKAGNASYLLKQDSGVLSHGKW
jgi:hypothetical protein